MLRVIPNLITAGRGLCGPVVLWLMLVADEPWIAFWVFAVGMMTDLFDGWLAQRWGSDRELGMFLDPLSDKVLGASTWIALWARGWAPPWLVIPLLTRDVMVAIGWRIAKGKGSLWTASRVGQVATSYEGASLGILLFHGPWLDVRWPVVGATVGLFGLTGSLISAIGYAIHGPPPPHAPDAGRVMGAPSQEVG